MDNTPKVPLIGRIVGAVFGIAFFCIGASVLGVAWSDELGSHPLVFRLVPSFISLVFMTVGGTIAFGAITGKQINSSNAMISHLKRRKQMLDELQGEEGLGSNTSNVSSQLECPRCGAPLHANADISPSGDVKCTHCDSWFNVRG